MRETWVWSLGWEDALGEGMATSSSILAWRTPMDRGAWWAIVHRVAKVGHDWGTKHSTVGELWRGDMRIIWDDKWKHLAHGEQPMNISALNFEGEESKIQILLNVSQGQHASDLGLMFFLYHIVSSVQFSPSVVSDSLRPHEPQHTRPPCPSPTPRVHPNPSPSSQWCHPTISSFVVPFSSCPQSFILMM